MENEYIDEKIDFGKEIDEFLRGQLIAKAEVLENTPTLATIQITTLEDIKILVICSTSRGIEVIDIFYFLVNTMNIR